MVQHNSPELKYMVLLQTAKFSMMFRKKYDGFIRFQHDFPCLNMSKNHHCLKINMVLMFIRFLMFESHGASSMWTFFGRAAIGQWRPTRDPPPHDETPVTGDFQEM